VKRKLIAVIAIILFILFAASRVLTPKLPGEYKYRAADIGVLSSADVSDAKAPAVVCAAPAPPSAETLGAPVTRADGPAIDPAGKKDIAAVLYYDNLKLIQSRDERLLGTIRASFADKEQETAFVRSYLRERGIDADVPDGVTYSQAGPLLQYYSDKAKTMMCFVCHFYFDGQPTGIGCTTLYWKDLRKAGSLAYGYDSEQGADYESLYDTDGKQAAYISYQDIADNPFPFIMEYHYANNYCHDTGNYNGTIGDALYKSQRFWIYKNLAEFDGSGEWTGYKGDIFRSDVPESHFDCRHDAKGRLEKIERRIQPGQDLVELKQIDFPTEIQFKYQDNGRIGAVDYTCAPWIYGTTSSSGEIYYDEKGRMVYETAYITHGSQYYFYLYNGGKEMPWACFYQDCGPCDSYELNGVEYQYGDYVSVYLFQTG